MSLKLIHFCPENEVSYSLSLTRLMGFYNIDLSPAGDEIFYRHQEQTITGINGDRFRGQRRRGLVCFRVSFVKSKTFGESDRDSVRVGKKGNFFSKFLL